MGLLVGDALAADGRGRRKVEFAPFARNLFRKFRYKILYGGRGAAKSTQVAKALLSFAHTQYERILCCRELQSSIADSVHALLQEQIAEMGLAEWFKVTQNSIMGLATGSEFIFKGLRHNVAEIKGTQGITKAWVEEGQLVSDNSWQLLIPTVRKEESEIWMTMNPEEEQDPSYQRFIADPPPEAFVLKVGWQDNPWFPETLNKERIYLLNKDPDAYEHVWNGQCRRFSNALVFRRMDTSGRGHYVVEAFDPPKFPYEPRFFHGLDFGFANDPNAFIRCWITESESAQEMAHHLALSPNPGSVLAQASQDLWIDQAVYGFHTEIDDLPAMLDKVDTARKWPIKGDGARPETISYLARKGFQISAAEKWQGCVEDRIAHIKGFRTIHVHPRCKQLIQEWGLYSYKRDRVTNEVLPVLVDAHNHGSDALGYALDGYIQKRGGLNQWLAL